MPSLSRDGGEAGIATVPDGEQVGGADPFSDAVRRADLHRARLHRACKGRSASQGLTAALVSAAGPLFRPSR